MIENLRPQVSQLTETLFQDLKELDSFNFVEEFASKLPAVAIAGLLGLRPATFHILLSLCIVLLGA